VARGLEVRPDPLDLPSQVGKGRRDARGCHGARHAHRRQWADGVVTHQGGADRADLAGFLTMRPLPPAEEDPRVHVEDRGELLDHRDPVDAALPALDFRDPALRAPHPAREGELGDAAAAAEVRDPPDALRSRERQRA
jgi:hypothetical protein